jgi:hypothetical protein
MPVTIQLRSSHSSGGVPGSSPGHVGFVVDEVALEQVSSEYFDFTCSFSFHRLLHIHHLSSGAGTVGQLVAGVPSGLSLTPRQETKKKKNIQPSSCHLSPTQKPKRTARSSGFRSCLEVTIICPGKCFKTDRNNFLSCPFNSSFQQNSYSCFVSFRKSSGRQCAERRCWGRDWVGGTVRKTASQEQLNSWKFLVKWPKNQSVSVYIEAAKEKRPS